MSSAAHEPQADRSVDPGWFRTVLGQYPTGVCVVTGVDPESGPAGLVVGSFTSVSLQPPMVAFFPDRASSSWPKVARGGSFCVNILGADQESVCRRFAVKGADKFEGQAYRAASSGSPVIEGCVAWIDCEIVSVQEAGDHFIVLGRVLDLQLERPRLPLLFFQGGYGRFTPSSLTAPDERGQLTQQLRRVDLIRSEMERLSARLGCQIGAGAHVGDEVVIVATAGQAGRDDSREAATLVGQRLPFLPPSGAVFAAWMDDDEVEAWLRQRWSSQGEPEEATLARWRRVVDNVRERGYSLGLLGRGRREFAAILEAAAHDPSAAPTDELFAVLQELVYDPDELTEQTLEAVRQISAPVFDAQERVAFSLTAYGFTRPAEGVDSYVEQVCTAAANATDAIGGRQPVRVGQETSVQHLR